MALIYCRECGKKYSDRAHHCPHCGYIDARTLRAINKLTNGKSIIVYLILNWFFGVFGVHRFYAGKTTSGIIMLILGLTFVGWIITAPWSLIDFIIGLFNATTPDKIFVSKK